MEVLEGHIGGRNWKKETLNLFLCLVPHIKEYWNLKPQLCVSSVESGPPVFLSNLPTNYLRVKFKHFLAY